MTDSPVVVGQHVMWCGDSRHILTLLPEQSVDFVFADPPYPGVRDKGYGEWDEDIWFEMMRRVTDECWRLLKPHGSMVVVIQPNFESLGRMRTWAWEFVTDVAQRYGVVQDVYWWNYSMPPTRASNTDVGLLRQSVKLLVWIGPPDCYRDQAAVGWGLSERTRAYIQRAQYRIARHPSGHRFDEQRIYEGVAARGYATPFNLLPFATGDPWRSGGRLGHGASTPADLCRWWLRYACPPGGIVLDPFLGSGTTVAVAAEEERIGWGIERQADYFTVAVQRVVATVYRRGAVLPA